MRTLNGSEKVTVTKQYEVHRSHPENEFALYISTMKAAKTASNPNQVHIVMDFAEKSYFRIFTSNPVMNTLRLVSNSTYLLFQVLIWPRILCLDYQNDFGLDTRGPMK